MVNNTFILSQAWESNSRTVAKKGRTTSYISKPKRTFPDKSKFIDKYKDWEIKEPISKVSSMAGLNVNKKTMPNKKGKKPFIGKGGFLDFSKVEINSDAEQKIDSLLSKASNKAKNFANNTLAGIKLPSVEHSADKETSVLIWAGLGLLAFMIISK